MDKLVNGKGQINWGIYDEPVMQVNYLDYDLQTPMGLTIPGFMKKILANQFHFIGIMGPDVIGGLAVVDLKFLSNGFFYLYDRTSKRLVEASSLVPFSFGTSVRPTPEHALSKFSSPGLNISIDQAKVSAKAKGISIDIELDAKQTNPIRICTKAGYRGWAYTHKSGPVRISGAVTIEGRKIEICSPSTMGLIDWSSGYMRRKTCWNWAASALSLPDGRSLGFNLSCGVNETSFTENALWVDGDMTKVDMVDFIFDMKNIMKPWIIKSFDKNVDLAFHPQSSRGEKIHAGIIASRFTQLVGVFEGTLKTDIGEIINIKRVPGYVEDHYAKW